jgi:hypothetical protein
MLAPILNLGFFLFETHSHVKFSESEQEIKL